MTAAGSGVGEASLSYLDQAWPIRCECVFGGTGEVRQGVHVLGGDAVEGRDPDDVHVGKLETERVRCVQEAGELLERGVLGVVGDDEDDRDVAGRAAREAMTGSTPARWAALPTMRTL
jgi:hypothetical protein